MFQPPMSKARMDLIDKAFNKLDKSGDGQVTMEDLKGTYDCKKHPKYLSGEWTAKQVGVYFRPIYNNCLFLMCIYNL